MDNISGNFNKEVSLWVSKGYTIVDKNDFLHTAILEKKPKVNHALHIILTLITGGAWIIVYLFLVLGKGNKSETVTISMGKPQDKKIDPLKNFYR